MSERATCANLTDVTLADEDTNSILADNANRAIHGNVAMQVTQPGRKISYASSAIWWPTMQLMQVVSSDDQQIYQCLKSSSSLKKIDISWKNYLSYRLYTLGSLCIWQCFCFPCSQDRFLTCHIFEAGRQSETSESFS